MKIKKKKKKLQVNKNELTWSKLWLFWVEILGKQVLEIWQLYCLTHSENVAPERNKISIP